ncbi:MAG: hypothetical protein HY005_00200 [Candidatus Staskawiczbacteria bacterium]|nr:hypothetical protein [Candidatus Staskawiczbacteria bacterium]MBI3337031.1 hypothetical protein [Candidatus Staskawiczbacteria bacterium]
MTSKNKFLAVSIVLLSLAFFIAPYVKANNEDANTDQVLTESASLDNELEPLEGVEVEEVKSMPSSFGFWWRNIKEWTSLALTIDPVKKSEKQLKFAEERARLANYIIQNSADPKIQEKAQQMMEKANEYMKKIEDRKDDLISRADEKSQKLLRNLAKHHLNKERILEKIEDKLPPEKIEEFQELRREIEEKSENFLDNLKNNPNITQELKDRVINVLSQVQDTQKIREEFRDQQKDILKEIKAGNQEAKKQFKELREARKEDMEELKEQFKKQKEDIINKIQDGDERAVEKLRQLNQERQKEAAKIREEMKQKAKEMKDEIQQKRKEALKQMQERKEQLKEQIKPAPTGN